MAPKKNKQSSPSKSADLSRSRSLGEVLKGTGGGLGPFIASFILYFIVYIPMEKQTFVGGILKCAPIWSLAYFIYTQGLHHSRNKIMFISIIFASMGDWFLDFPGYFLHGTVSFTVHQLLNIYTFGMYPLNMWLGAKVFAVMGLPLLFVGPKMMALPTMDFIIINCYIPTLITMIWRSIHRVDCGSNCSWERLFPMIGAIAFGFSDSCVGLNKFYAPLPHAQLLIMVSYYIAELGLALTVLETPLLAKQKMHKK